MKKRSENVLKNIEICLKNAFEVNFVSKYKIKTTLKYWVSPKTHFMLMDKRVET